MLVISCTLLSQLKDFIHLIKHKDINMALRYKFDFKPKFFFMYQKSLKRTFHMFFDYKISFENYQQENTDSKTDFILENLGLTIRFKDFCYTKKILRFSTKNSINTHLRLKLIPSTTDIILTLNRQVLIAIANFFLLSSYINRQCVFNHNLIKKKSLQSNFLSYVSKKIYSSKL